MKITSADVNRIKLAVQEQRLLDTARRLIEIPSPTRSAGAVADELADLLQDDGFTVERPEAGWPTAPAVVARFDTGVAGPTLQFNGHLDTVHLPFVPPRVENGLLYGSGASDMKGGIAAMVEATRVLKDTGTLTAGAILITAHDLHELPWGDGSQVDALISAGYVGDGVLLPEYLCDRLPVIGRGLAVLEITITRAGEPVHEVMGGLEQPSVIRAGADLIQRFHQLDQQLALKTHPLAGRESLFVGRAAGGEIYNQSPVEFQITGTRRWLPGTSIEFAERQYQEILAEVAQATGTQISGRFQVARDACEFDEQHPLVQSFQQVCGLLSGTPLPIGAKPFVDDGNTFASRAGIPAITHGPNGIGAHTVHEEVPVAELVRVAAQYALTAMAFCNSEN